MADPKKVSVQKTIELLNRMKTKLDEEIRQYEDEELDVMLGYDSTGRDATKGRITKLVGKIDEFILENPDVSALIGASTVGKEDADKTTIEALNSAIAAVLAKVSEIKEKGVEGIDFDTKTGKVVEEVSKLDALDYTEKDVDYDKIDERIDSLKSAAEKEEYYNRYQVVKSALKTKDVSDNYQEFTSKMQKQLNEYKALEDLKGFSAADLKGKVGGKFTFTRNKGDVEKLLEALKKAKGKSTVTITGINKNNPIEIGKLTIDELSKLKSDTAIRSAVDQLIVAAEVKDTDLEAKAGEMLTTLNGNASMKNLFVEDRDTIKAVLEGKPVDIAKLQGLLDEMVKTDGKNIGILADMETYKSIGNTDGLKKELARLTEIKKRIDAEKVAKGKTFETDEVEQVKVGAVEVKLEKGDKYTGRIVDLEDEKDMKKVIGATYRSMDADKREELSLQVIEDSKRGNRLPIQIPFISRFLAQFRKDKMTNRERAIATRIKEKIKDGIINAQTGSKERAEGKHLREVEIAAEEKENAFTLDKATRERVNAAAREAARESLIKNKGTQTADKAMGSVDKAVIEDAENKAKEDVEGR